MENKFLAFDGEIYTIEWYFNSQDKSHVKEYYKDLPTDIQKKLAKLFIMLGDSGVIRSEEKFNYEGNKIYAFKPKPHRFLCFFFQDGKVIVTNAFEKKKDKMPPKELDKALKLKNDYIQRCKGGNYYD